MKIGHICDRYNSYVSVMKDTEKRITSEQSRAYWAAFEGKKSIEKTLRDLDWYLIFDDHGRAVNAMAMVD